MHLYHWIAIGYIWRSDNWQLCYFYPFLLQRWHDHSRRCRLLTTRLLYRIIVSQIMYIRAVTPYIHCGYCNPII